VIIEHLEDRLSRWLLIEYRHAVSLVDRDRLVFTNVRRPEWRAVLSGLGQVFEEPIEGTPLMSVLRRLIVLDPRARTLLNPEDFAEKPVGVVVGGILGDHPPRGRTYRLLTRRLLGLCEPRSLGPCQFSIDGAVYMALQVASGRRLYEIPVVKGVKVVRSWMGMTLEVELPYCYPLHEGKPWISSELLDYLAGEVALDEVLELAG